MNIMRHAINRAYERFNGINNIRDEATDARLMGNFIKFDDVRNTVVYEYKNRRWVFDVAKNTVVTVCNVHKKIKKSGNKISEDIVTHKKEIFYKFIRNKKKLKQINRELRKWGESYM
jgi:hypothetical protein